MLQLPMPESGIISDAHECTPSACEPADERCTGRSCGDECGHVDGGAENGDREAGFPAPPARYICDADLDCVLEHEHEGCGI